MYLKLTHVFVIVYWLPSLAAMCKDHDLNAVSLYTLDGTLNYESHANTYLAASHNWVMKRLTPFLMTL